MFAVKAIVLALLPLATVVAQTTSASASASSTSTSTSASSTGTGISVPGSCITDCSQAAAVKNGCVTFSNITCVCTSAQFQADAGSCIQDFCPDQLSTALTLQKAECVGKTATGSVTETPFTQTNLASLTSSGASSTSTAPGNSGSSTSSSSTSSSSGSSSGSSSSSSSSSSTGSSTNGASTTSNTTTTTTSGSAGQIAHVDFRAVLTAGAVLVLGSLIGGVVVL